MDEDEEVRQQLSVELGHELYLRLIEFDVRDFMDAIYRLKDEPHDAPKLFVEFRKINKDNSIELPAGGERRRGTILFYVVKEAATSQLMLFHGENFPPDSKADPLHRVRVYHYNQASQEKPQATDGPVPLRVGDKVLVSEAHYLLKCDDPDGAIVLMAGIDLGLGDKCAGRPCP